MENKKRKGGAEKIRAKKKLALQADAAKCAKISQLFGGGFSGASTSVKLASDGGQQVEEGKGRQEEERPETAAGPSGRTELEVRSYELQSIWVRL